MLSKLSASIRKEYLLLIRDKVGLSILFLMPMVLVLVMTLIQDSAFKSINERGIPLVLVDDDRDSLGITIEQGLRGNTLCSFSDSIDGKPATADKAREAVAEGKFLLAILIPRGATASIRKNVRQLVDQSMQELGGGDSAMALSLDSVQIGILIDPVTKKSFVTSVISNLREFISEIKNKIMFRAFADRLAELVPDKDKVPRNAYSQTQIVTYRESYASQAQTIIPNAVQHNVPAWAIFAMFFIAIPLCGSIMKEKSEGSAFRLHTMPSPYLLLTLGKLIVYVIVCLIQLLLMLCLGIFLLPILGLPALALGHSWFALFMLSFCTALAATGYGIMVGTLASTEQQGAILGSFSILLFSALGGIWVPSYVMPDVMRSISVFSPMNWSLDGYYKLFLRGAGLSALRADCFKLLAFFVLTLGLATWVYRAGRKI